MKVRCHGSGELGAGAASFPNFSSTACRVDGVRGAPQRVRDVPAHAVDATHTHPHTRKSAAKKKKQDPSLHGPDDGVVPQVLVARPRGHGLL